MKLLDLPVEIIDEIIDLTLPSSFEPFALCCRAIYTRASSKIARHNSLKKRWRCTTIGNRHRGDILRILCEIACDPLVGRYIESLSLRYRGGGPNVDTTNDGFTSNKDIMELIKNMVTRSGCFDKAGVDAQLWWEDVLEEIEVHNAAGNDQDDDDAVCMTVSLLSQLPNLQTLQLPSGWYRHLGSHALDADGEKRLIAVLDAMVEAANSNQNQDRALRNLRIILPSFERGYEQRAAFQVLEPFMRLKSLEELYSTSCIATNDDYYTGKHFEWRFPGTKSSLRKVELRHCCMDAAGISVLLTHAPLLSIFTYSHECKWHGCELDWNVGAFVEALAQHCGQTLTKLSITTQREHGAIANGVTSFRSFTQLRLLEIDLALFCGPSVASGQRIGLDAVLPVGATSWTIADIPCLGDMLPASIVNVRINNNGAGMEPLGPLLKDFAQKRASRLHSLVELALMHFPPREVRALFPGEGVERLLMFHETEWPSISSPTVLKYLELFHSAAMASNAADTRPAPIMIRQGRSTRWVYPDS